LDLSVDYVGLKLKNPLIAAAGPLTRNGAMMKKALDAGFAAVVTETIVTEVRRNVRPRLVNGAAGMGNIGLYSDFTLEEWESEIAQVKEAGGIVIANILAHTPSEMSYIARVVEKYGADAIELGVAAPHGEGLEVLSSDPDRMYGLAAATVDAVELPVIVKMSPNVTNLSKLALAVERSGASAISAIDTVRSIIGVDLETGRALLPTYGGYSGAAVRPIGLAAVATIAQTVDIQVSGIGGVENYHDALEYIMLGASTVQLLTAIVLHGYSVVPSILEGMKRWMARQGHESLSGIRGKALASLYSFEELRMEPYTARVTAHCAAQHCDACVTGCMYEAVVKDEGIYSVDKARCAGCGLCVSLCPEKCFMLEWGP